MFWFVAGMATTAIGLILMLNDERSDEVKVSDVMGLAQIMLIISVIILLCERIFSSIVKAFPL